MLRLFPAALAIAVTTAIASPALAQDQGFTVSLGYFGPTGADGRVNGDVLNADRCIDVTFACEPLFFSVGDFGGFIINGEYAVRPGQVLRGLRRRRVLPADGAERVSTSRIPTAAKSGRT